MPNKTALLEYMVNGNLHRVSIRDIEEAMCKTNECLDAGFNIQLQMLVDLLKSRDSEIISLDKISEQDLGRLSENFPGTTIKTIQAAIKAYHKYATNSYEI